LQDVSSVLCRIRELSPVSITLYFNDGAYCTWTSFSILNARPSFVAVLKLPVIRIVFFGRATNGKLFPMAEDKFEAGQ
jgi:hypothetical protein